jgi:predicted RNase H-like nuclease
MPMIGEVPTSASHELIGLDGIRGGWIAAVSDGAGRLALRRADTLGDACRWVIQCPHNVLVIDIPIGVPESTPRRADLEARAFLGLKGSSVFPCPYAGMLPAAALPLRAAQQDASRRRREIEGSTKGCSIQAAAILPKIAEAEVMITPDLQAQVHEGHPEVSFAVMNGGRPVLTKKKRIAGREARLALLAPSFGDLRMYIAVGRQLGAEPDDVLDAFAMLWTARRIVDADPDLLLFPRIAERASGGKTAQIVA